MMQNRPTLGRYELPHVWHWSWGNWLGRGLTSREHASGYMRRPCYGHEWAVCGSSWSPHRRWLVIWNSQTLGAISNWSWGKYYGLSSWIWRSLLCAVYKNARFLQGSAMFFSITCCTNVGQDLHLQQTTLLMTYQNQVTSRVVRNQLQCLGHGWQCISFLHFIAKMRKK